MAVSTQNILKNIYGVQATGTLANMSGGNASDYHFIMRGGAVSMERANGYVPNVRPEPNIKYLDGNDQHPQNLNGGFMLIGGAAKKKTTKIIKKKTIKRKATGNKNDILYESPDYIDNPNLQEFINKFFLHYRVTRSPNGAIYIVPPQSTLKDMVSKRGAAPEGSAELSEAVRANADKIGYERYLFVTYGNNSNKDKYRIVDESTGKEPYPASSFGTIRRTNIKGEVFYITCDDKLDVKIHTKPDNFSSGLKLDYIGRFRNGGYIFQGAIPDKAVEVIPPKKSNARAYAKLCSKLLNTDINNMEFGEMFSVSPKNRMIGGASGGSLELLNLYTKYYKNDYDLAAEHYLKAVDKKHKLSSKYSQNGDLLYTALYHALSEPSEVSINDFGYESSRIMDDFKADIKGSKFLNSVKNVGVKLSKIYKQCRTSNDYSKFITSYKNLYAENDLPKIKADVMTSFLRNSGGESVITANKLIDDIFTTPKPSAAQCAIIKNAFNIAPLPSAFGTENPPLFSNDDNSFESIMGKNGSAMSEDDDDFAGEILEAKRKASKKSRRPTKRKNKAVAETQEGGRCGDVEDIDEDDGDGELYEDDNEDKENGEIIEPNAENDDVDISNIAALY